jgi:hypothetical protein
MCCVLVATVILSDCKLYTVTMATSRRSVQSPRFERRQRQGCGLFLPARKTAARISDLYPKWLRETRGIKGSVRTVLPPPKATGTFWLSTFFCKHPLITRGTYAAPRTAVEQPAERYAMSAGHVDDESMMTRCGCRKQVNSGQFSRFGSRRNKSARCVVSGILSHTCNTSVFDQHQAAVQVRVQLYSTQYNGCLTESAVYRQFAERFASCRVKSNRHRLSAYNLVNSFVCVVRVIAYDSKRRSAHLLFYRAAC